MMVAAVPTQKLRRVARVSGVIRLTQTRCVCSTGESECVFMAAGGIRTTKDTRDAWIDEGHGRALFCIVLDALLREQ